MSVLCVLYVAIEPTLLKANPRSQWDVEFSEDSYRFVQRKYGSVLFGTWFLTLITQDAMSDFVRLSKRSSLSVLDLVLLLLRDLFRGGKGFQK